MNQVVGYNEFKQKMRLYLVNLAKDIRQGKKTEQTIYVLLGPPGIGKSFISEKVAEGMGRTLINVDLGGRKDTGILEGVSPSVKAAYPGRICQGISVGKDRGAIILLDEFEKVADEGLSMMLGNVLDIKKNKDWYDQFLGYRVDLSDCILLCTANYADQVPDFVQNRAEMVNIELAKYEQRVGYVLRALRKKLRSDTDTAGYAEELTEEFCKYIITEE
jgi:ATP-dependent Lon protease